MGEVYEGEIFRCGVCFQCALLVCFGSVMSVWGGIYGPRHVIIFVLYIWRAGFRPGQAREGQQEKWWIGGGTMN